MDRDQLLLDSVTDYAFVISDSKNFITQWSAGAERILGYSEEEALGKSGSIFFTEEDRARGEDEKEIATALRYGRAEDERWHVRKDGSRFWASGVMTALRDESGSIIGIAKVMRDLTERKLAQERLRQSEERFRLLVENVKDHALFQLNLDGTIAGWNTGSENIFGYKEEEVLGKPFEVLFSPDDRERARQELRTALETGRGEDALWLTRKDGSAFFARWSTHPIRDDEGKLRGFAKVLRDETERRQEEKQALFAAEEKEQRRIARDLHDSIAQSLVSFEIQLQHLRNDGPGIQDWDARVSELQDRVSAFIGEVRDLSHRIHPSIVEDLGFKAAVRDLVYEYGHFRDLPVRLEIADEVPSHLPLDLSTSLYRILQEGLQNASRHAGEDVLVTVSLSVAEGALHMVIEDTGVGFDLKSSKTKGSLGLLSMSERAGLVGGKMHVATAPGQGTSIRIAVPLPA